jgi:hypothetical protein
MTRMKAKTGKVERGLEQPDKPSPSYLEELEKDGPIATRERIVIGGKARNLPRRLPAADTGEA